MAQAFNSKLAGTTYEYAKQLNVAVTRTTVHELIEENPFYPSLYSLSNTFDRLGIINEAYQVEAHQFDELEPPFVVYMSGLETGKDFALVTRSKDNTVTYSFNNKNKKISKEKFLEQWEKIAFMAEPAPISGEADYKKNIAKEKARFLKRKALQAGGVLLLLLTVCFFAISIPQAVIFLELMLLPVKLIGLATTILLLIYEVDKSSSFVKNICSAGKQTNCDAVLNSKASKILGMSWGEAGFFYFISTTLFLLFPGIDLLTKAMYISLANAMASPYIFFSIYYQRKIIKQWCVLCLAVQAMLALELVWSAVMFWQHPVWITINFSDIIILTLAITFPIVTWFTLKPIFLQARTSKEYKHAYKRLLYNPDIFNGLLQKQQQAATGHESLGITIGNPRASNTIIKVCNPYCGPCAKAHPALEEIVKHNNDVNVRIIFTSTNGENDSGGLVARHLLAIAEKGDALQTQQALDDWYGADKKDYGFFANKYPMNGEAKKQLEKLDAMSKWCKEADITHTPTIFINGKRLPETYSVEELKYIF